MKNLLDLQLVKKMLNENLDAQLVQKSLDQKLVQKLIGADVSDVIVSLVQGFVAIVCVR